MQTLALGREACAAFQTPRFPPTRVWPVDPNFDFNGLWIPKAPKKLRVRADPKEEPKPVLTLVSALVPTVSITAAPTTIATIDTVPAAITESGEEPAVGPEPSIEQEALLLPESASGEWGEDISYNSD